MTISFCARARIAAEVSAFVALGVLAGTVSSKASPVLTQAEASATVLANGFKLVVRAEPAKADPAKAQMNPAAWESAAASPRWDVWAVKDGIAYRVTVDGGTGDLVGAAPAVEDD